jgi:hypothetical protein
LVHAPLPPPDGADPDPGVAPPETAGVPAPQAAIVMIIIALIALEKIFLALMSASND